MIKGLRAWAWPSAWLLAFGAGITASLALVYAIYQLWSATRTKPLSNHVR